MSDSDARPTIRAFAPGRVNLIGDHTDHTGGWCLPMALQWGTTVEGIPGGGRVRLTSELDDATTDIDIDHPDLEGVRGWARHVAAVAAEIAPTTGFTGTITTDLPIGAGLSSSAALGIALSLALGFDGELIDLAKTAQRAEHRATGVPCGVMDQLAAVFGRHGHALLIDCSTLEVLPVAIPEGAEFRIIDPGQSRNLTASPYADRRAACELAEAQIGPLRDADLEALHEITDPEVRRRARHVITENQRVMSAAKALRRGDWATLGALMSASHRSLRDDLEVSTPILDQVVESLWATPGVHGARLTGAGFGGCVVALCDPGALDFAALAIPSRGARLALG